MLIYLEDIFINLINNKHFIIYVFTFYIYQQNYHEQYQDNIYYFLIDYIIFLMNLLLILFICILFSFIIIFIHRLFLIILINLN